MATLVDFRLLHLESVPYNRYICMVDGCCGIIAEI